MARMKSIAALQSVHMPGAERSVCHQNIHRTGSFQHLCAALVRGDVSGDRTHADPEAIRDLERGLGQAPRARGR